MEFLGIFIQIEELFLACATAPDILFMSIRDPLETLAEKRMLPMYVLPPVKRPGT